ncbi:MAG: hypothetical protein PHV34_00265 [Verrucomicrobiae bacterium]|nr:hypothetical protein [Verrucomicrobiae bacterium]
MKMSFRLLFWLVFSLWFHPAVGLPETFQVVQRITAYDPTNSFKQLGFFDPPATLEIEDYDPETRMYRVNFKDSNG